jgi:uncharacterized membrane protein (DUF106 family)
MDATNATVAAKALAKAEGKLKKVQENADASVKKAVETATAKANEKNAKKLEAAKAAVVSAQNDLKAAVQG